VKEQTVSIYKALNQPKIDMLQLQKVTFNGIPDEIKGLRPLVWSILLGHLPTDTAKWDSHLETSLANYEVWKQELIIKPSIKAAQEERDAAKHIIDHPLSTNYNS
jgi:hypothetical protein